MIQYFTNVTNPKIVVEAHDLDLDQFVFRMKMLLFVSMHAHHVHF